MNAIKEIEMKLAQAQRESKARRAANPNWPSHKPYLYDPYGRTIAYESMPTGKIRNHTGYCKYCYETHGNWWMMDQRDYEVGSVADTDPVILCGYCEHTSRKGFTET